MTPRLLITALALLLTACEIPGFGSAPDPRIAQRESDAKAVGGACRLAMRGIEECYGLNPKSSKSAVFAGWKEMDQYMRDNKMEGIRPVAVKAEPEEVVVDDKKPKADAKEKPAGDAKAKLDEADPKAKTSPKAKPKVIEKLAGK